MVCTIYRNMEPEVGTQKDVKHPKCIFYFSLPLPHLLHLKPKGQQNPNHNQFDWGETTTCMQKVSGSISGILKENQERALFEMNNATGQLNQKKLLSPAQHSDQQFPNWKPLQWGNSFPVQTALFVPLGKQQKTPTTAPSVSAASHLCTECQAHGLLGWKILEDPWARGIPSRARV